MRVVLSWMSEFAELPDDPARIAEACGNLGLSVESIETVGSDLAGVVVAKVLDVRPHPDADRIRLVDVDAGDGEPLQIACGASNLEVGILVPLATIGTVMPDGMEIARRKMRGEWSNGMLSSAKELGLGDDHEGILHLPADLPLGAPVGEVLGVSAETVIELEVEANRPDALSMAGVARDLAAYFDVPFSLPDPQVPTSGAEASELASVRIEDTELCGRFVARVLSGVDATATSPRWMAQRLTAAGMRPISAVVDVSNYVMLELGQPSHTYDLARLPGGALVVRDGAEGETIETLDDVTRTLSAGDGVIADGTGAAVGIAGVMGGASTEISDATTDVLLELAWWRPERIQVTTDRLKLHSEAGTRFRRGADVDMPPLAARRAAQLLVDITGATLHPGEIDEAGDAPESLVITLRTAQVNRITGGSLTTERSAAHLRSIGFDVTEGDDETLRVSVPSWRTDVTEEINLIEEVARLEGYNTFPNVTVTSPFVGALTRAQADTRLLRSTLVGRGVTEVSPLPFLSVDALERCGLTGVGAPGVINPLVAEQSVLRPSLMPGLVDTLAANARTRSLGLSIYEIGNVFPGREVVADPLDADTVLAGERSDLAVALAGAAAPQAVQLLGVLLDTLGFGAPELDQSDDSLPGGLHPTRSAIVAVEGVPVGEVGEIDPGVLRASEVSERVAWLRLDLDVLLALPHPPAAARPVSRYPAAVMDLAFVVDEAVPAAALRRALTEAGGDLLERLSLFDEFRGDSIGEHHKSLAWSVTLRAADRTLSDDEVTA
ncbi:MAG: phenylalanine--tRNA ligase subunit beta, partial [Microthrixaceae bacterium]|nr:phenylalanine--tRNA ligase subunit beta [Microthrixaceae bacterium]